MIIEIVENLDNVPEAEKATWTETDGKFQRTVEMPDVTKLKSALKAEREAAAAASAKLAAFKDIDPATYAELLKAKEEGLTEKERYENALKKRDAEVMRIKEESALKEKDLTGKLHKFHLDREARAAALAAGVIPGDIDDVLLLTAANRSLDDEGNIIVVDKDGDPLSKTLQEFYETDFKAAKPKYFPGIPGGGSTPPGGYGKVNSADLMKLPPEERINAARGIK